MFKYLDPYTLRARLSPAILAAAPAFAAVALLISWTQFSLSNTIATAGLVALLFALADIARRRGKKIQPQLYAELGGMPSTTMLRHSDSTIDAASKARYVAFLAGKLNEPAPTEVQEKADPAAADAFYGRCGDWLRENTRNAKKFNILFNENVTYGFRRNLLGMKWSALALNLLVVVVSGCVLYHRSVPFQDIQHVEGRVIVVFVVAVLHALYIGFGVSRTATGEAAKAYARQLILSCETLINKAKPAPAPAAAPKPKKPKKDKSETVMAKVTVYQWAKYDIRDDASQKSRRWATREAIEWAGGYPLEDTATEIDESALGGEVDGMTNRNFDPHATKGFQTRVRG